MRAIAMFLWVAVLASAAACGPTKPAESPSSGDEASSKDGEGKKPEADAPSRPAPPPAPAPEPVAQGSGVPYDKDMVETKLKVAARQVKANCGSATDSDGNATGPWGKGTVTVKLGHNGHAQGATVGAPFDGKPVGKCIARAFAIVIYPPFSGDDATVDWPVEVVQPAAPAAPAAPKR